MRGHNGRNEIIDLTEDDDSVYIPDGDVVLLATPPPNMRKRNNAARPIDVDAEEDIPLERFTPEETEWRRMLMMDHDVMVEERPKRKGEDAPEGSKKIKSGNVASGSGEASTPVTPESPTLDTLVAQLLGVIPDMCPEHASKELQFLLATRQSDNAVETILTKAFDEGYPKFTRERVVEEEGGEEKYAGKVYRAEKRRGLCYQALSNAALEESFPFVPVPYIRSVQNKEDFLFGPTYLQLVADDLNVVKPFTILKRPRPGKGKASMPQMDAGGVEFELEKNWILAHAATLRVKRDAEIAKKLADEAEWAAGGGVECGCCFDDFLPDCLEKARSHLEISGARVQRRASLQSPAQMDVGNANERLKGKDVKRAKRGPTSSMTDANTQGDMFQCRDGHLFCKECCIRHTETKLGDEIHIILCMDTSGCQSRFDEKELGRALPKKSLELLQRLRFAQELEDAAIEGLETCPSCPWAVVIDNPDEKLFRCQNEACGKVSCRQCRKVEHLPKSCEEYAAFLKEDKRHAVEDAMSEALIRKCPKCAKPYIKDSGCNKIRCVKCQSVSCYICQKLIGGYDHFHEHRQPGAPTGSGPACKLWDHDEARNDAANVVRARDAAVAAQQQRAALEGMELEEADLAVDAPAAPPAGPDQIMNDYLRGMGPPPPGHIRRYDPAQMVARFGMPPGLDAIPRLPPVPLPGPGAFAHLLDAQAPIFRPLVPAPLDVGARLRRHRRPPPPEPYDPVYEDFLVEAQAIERLRDQMREQNQQGREQDQQVREQMRILRGPPAIEAERAAIRAERREARDQRAERVLARDQRAVNLAELQAERDQIGGELAGLVARGRAQVAQREIRFEEEDDD